MNKTDKASGLQEFIGKRCGVGNIGSTEHRKGTGAGWAERGSTARSWEGLEQKTRSFRF